jgi:hypothetical protein
LGKVLEVSTERAVDKAGIDAVTPTGCVMRRHIDQLADHNGLLQAFAHSGPLERQPAVRTNERVRTSRYVVNDQTWGGTSWSETWQSRSGRLFHFASMPLFTCRAPARAAYVLARRDTAGHAVALFVGVALSLAPTLNLARIRQRAASLGATEVHLLDLDHAQGTYAARRLVRDLRAGLSHAAA